MNKMRKKRSTKRKSRKGNKKPKRKSKKGKRKSRKGKKKSKKRKSRKGKKKSKRKSRKGKKKSKKGKKKGKKKSKRKSKQKSKKGKNAGKKKSRKKSKKGKKAGKKKSKRKPRKGKKKSVPKTKNQPKENLKSSLEKILRSVHPQRSLGKETITWLEKITRKITVLFTSEIKRKEDAEKVLKNLLTKELAKHAIQEIRKSRKSFDITPETIIRIRKVKYEIAQIVAVVVEYLLTEILELGGDITRNDDRKMVTLSDIKRAIEHDRELTTLMEQLK